MRSNSMHFNTHKKNEINQHLKHPTPDDLVTVYIKYCINSFGFETIENGRFIALTLHTVTMYFNMLHQKYYIRQ